MAVFIPFLVIFVSLSAYYTLSFGSDSMFQFGKSELDKLSKGEVIVKTEQSGDNHKRRALAAILIDSPAQRVWNVITDCDHSPEFFPHLKSCKILQRYGDTQIIEQQVKLFSFLPEFTYELQSNYQKFTRIDFKKVSGDLRTLDGSWVLERAGDGEKTIVIYSVSLDPGFFVPQWLVRQILRRDLPDVLLAIRKRVSDLFPQ